MELIRIDHSDPQVRPTRHYVDGRQTDGNGFWDAYDARVAVTGDDRYIHTQSTSHDKTGQATRRLVVHV